MSAAIIERAEKTSALPRTGFRPELQGLRALAVGLVLLFHLWPERISGGFVGVDVFFVVSGYLITGHLYRELSSTGTISLAKFWARRVMRLLPLAFTVLVVSFIALLVFLPPTVWSMNIRQMLGSLFYVENWVLAADSVDYMGAENEPSLVQHYWSLSIEEQFYILLPLLLLGSFVLTKILRRPSGRSPLAVSTQRLILWTLVLVALASLIFSILFTEYNVAQAYFVTPTRFWEFATGGIVAMLPPVTKISDRFQNLLGWTGLIAILLAGFFYSGATPFPGYTALLPVVGTAMFIRYGSKQALSGVYWWSARPVAQRIGDWSYAIYLWHWPLIIVATYQLEDFRWPSKLLIIAVTLALSAASKKYIEDPLRLAPLFKLPRRAFTMMVSSIAVIAISLSLLPGFVSPSTDQKVTISDCVGADALISDCEDTGLAGPPVIPATQVQSEAEEPAYPECDIPAGHTDFDRSACSLGASEESAELTIAILGDSHARAWLPMLDRLGHENNWNIQGYTKSGCTPVPLDTANENADITALERSEACRTFVEETSDFLRTHDDIDVIMTAASPTDKKFYLSGHALSQEKVNQTVQEMWLQWSQAHKQVIVIGEVPHFDSLNGPTCVASHPDNLIDQCAVDAQEILNTKNRVLTTAANSLENNSEIAFYDPKPGICDAQRCYSVVGGLITRYDHHHLSSDFATSFTPDFLDFMSSEQVDLDQG